MTLPDQGTPVGHHDVANTNDTPGNPPALPSAANYGSDGIPSYMYEGYTPAPAVSPMPTQPVYSPMAGYAMQQNATWASTPQDMQTDQLGQTSNLNLQHHTHHHPHQLQAGRAVGLAPSNWFSQSQPHYSSHLPAGPSTPSIATDTSYMMSPSFSSHSPTMVGSPSRDHTFAQEPVFQAGTPAMQLASGSGAMQHTYDFLHPEQHEQQMMSMAAAMNAQQHQMRIMMPQQPINSLANNQLPAATPSWPAAQGQAFYYSQFGYSPVRDLAMGYGYMQAMPNVPQGPYPGAVPQPMYLSTMMVSNSITSLAHPQMMQQQQPQQQQPPPYPGPSTSFSHALEDDTRNEARRKFVRTDSGTGGALSNRSSSVDVHGNSHAAPMAEAAPGSVSSQQTDNFHKVDQQGEPQNSTTSAFTGLPEISEYKPPSVASPETHMYDAVSTVGESDAGEDNDSMCLSPLRKRSLSVACSDEWNDTGKAGEIGHSYLATVPENGRLEPDTRGTPIETAKKAKVTAPAAPPPALIPQISTGKQEAVFVHMDAAEILQSSHSIFPDEHDPSAGPIKPVKFRPAGNAPIKVRKWSTVVHPPPPESGYGSMPREVDFDHSASNVFLQHPAQPVAPSSVTSKFKSATSSFSAKSKAKQDGIGSASLPSLNHVRTLNWRPSDDRISTASAGLPPKTTAKAARLEEKKKTTSNDDIKAAKNTDAAQPDAESDEPMSVSKALAALSGKRGRTAQTARVARTKQVRKRTDATSSKLALDLKAAEKPTGSTANPEDSTPLAKTRTDSIATE
ncbi:hypothetical protein F503_05625 [Ophiostoma piceae UAMH 11346]|uniref:Uncharacterized protein n=1 Tax=Ophiostoma piceae (strain UAMH 11346) TaxID=1262450 RepID=S3DAG6_OPHP1|nr:hypothetical protein F503_05625 [Ophiostoma piceae UAMH 11346]